MIESEGDVMCPFEVEEPIVTVAKDYIKVGFQSFQVQFLILYQVYSSLFHRHDGLQEAIGMVIVSKERHSQINLQQLLR